MGTTPQIRVSKNGPYLVEGALPLANQHIVPNEKGESIEWREGEPRVSPDSYALCRCGHSKSKPFCDSTHKRIEFDGTETASREPYEKQAKRIGGPVQILEDAESLCAGARFCDPHGQVWNLVQQRGTKELVEHETGHCPSGRLLSRDRASGKPFEPQLPPSLGLVQDTAEGVSGPIWVRGGIPVIAADGQPYERRNRVTLCRCGASSNKPFCDGSHVPAKFTDKA